MEDEDSLDIPNPAIKSAQTPPKNQDFPLERTQDYQDLFRNATNRALSFLSNASNESLGACLIGLGATTYIVLGRVGLVLIGVVGGVVLHATWDGSRGGDHDGDVKRKEAARRREVGLDVVQRVMDWQGKDISHLSDGETDALGIAPTQESDYSTFRSQTADALNIFTDAVIRDYVKWWYSPILPAELSFPSACRRTLVSFISALSTNIARKRPADTFLEFTTNSSSIVIVFFNELSSALAASPTSVPADAVETYLRLKPQSNLASIMDQRHQHRKLQMIAEDILESYLEAGVYKCSPARTFLREILAHSVLDTTIQKCSRADWINEWIVYLLEEGEPELLNVIDAGVESAGAQNLGKQVTNAQKEISNEDPPGDSHMRSKSRAEEAMDEAMREAQRLTALIAEEEEKRQRRQYQRASTPNLSDTSDSTNHGVQTPSSSQSEVNGDSELASSHPNPNIIPEEHQNEIQENARTPQNDHHFTTFDQLAPQQVPTALQDPTESDNLTLRNAQASIFDDVGPGDKRPYKAKPTIDYMIQIEPASSSFPGWMIARTYADFEVLHEVLRRISTITGIEFNHVHASLPAWKGRTRTQLCHELERYLTDALRHEQLAESEGMKRFLEKTRGMTQAGGNKPGFWPNSANVGKGMFDALTKAPNQVAGGGKAFFGGVTNVLGAGGVNALKKNAPSPLSVNGASRPSIDVGRISPTTQSSEHVPNDTPISRPSSTLNSQTESRPPLPPRRSSSINSHKAAQSARPAASPRSSLLLERPMKAPRNATPPNEFYEFSSSATRNVKLPPPPEEMPDDYASPARASPRINLPDHSAQVSLCEGVLEQIDDNPRIAQMSVDGTNFFDVPTPPTPRSPRPRSPQSSSERQRSPPNSKTNNSPTLRQPPQRSSSASPNPSQQQPPNKDKEPSKEKKATPLTEQEAQVTIELLFAVINELYTLSSAWQIRRTLLTAAKTFLLRPGNPQLESIRTLLQESVLETNVSDAGMAGHVLKLRENTVPTEEELKTWPAERSSEDKEKLRVKARKLLCERGMPVALTGVMGGAASGEALGKVFDCLQVEEVARGVMFGLCLQGIRAMTQ